MMMRTEQTRTAKGSEVVLRLGWAGGLRRKAWLGAGLAGRARARARARARGG